MEVVTVHFERIFPHEVIDVPLADAWTFFETYEHPLDGHYRVTVRDDDGKTYQKFAKSWMIWDDTMKRWRLVRIGLGANGDYGPENPALVGMKIEQWLSDEGDCGLHWVQGINHH